MSAAAHPPTAARPVVALDVDGVLNPDTDVPGFTTTPLHLDAARLPKSPFVRGAGRRDLDIVVRTSAAHATWITALRLRADVVWATTWEDAANIFLAPILGIDPLPVAVSCAKNPPKFGYARSGDSAAWKASVLEDAFPGRPLVWIDDSAWMYDGPWRDDNPWRDGPTLVVVPDETVGLNAGDMARVDAFVAAHTA